MIVYQERMLNVILTLNLWTRSLSSRNFKTNIYDNSIM